MKKLPSALLKAGLLILPLLFTCQALLAGGYTFSVDLRNVKDDKLMVELVVPPVDKDVIEYQMPKIVPGTYSISDFGRFISELQAFDKDGNKLEVEKLSENRWKINKARALHKISYWVEDTWDSKQSKKIFEPGGTNIEAGKNFVINTFGFFGYLEGMKEMPFKLEITKPEGFYGSTALIASESTADKDIYELPGYFELADAPLMYCKPDTSIRKVGGADVLVSVYSPNGRVGADAIMGDISEILSAQKAYLGGELPVEKYAFLIYLTDRVGGSGGMGALEHSYSSLYYMPETEESAAGAMMRDVAAHEFFHIVTPLSIHSEEIHYFDFINPKMSKHLWLYEGVTEYSAGHVQVKHGLITKGDYLSMLRQKITMANFFIDTVAFTDISAKCLEEYKSQYVNVYQKGALIGMAMDIQLRHLSDGKMGMQELMQALAKEFGKDNPFKDDELFDKIVALTYPEIGEFIRKHVDGPEPLPYADLFKLVGVIYEPVATRSVLSLGRVGLKFDKESGYFEVGSNSRMNKFGKQLGYEIGDRVLEFDGIKLTMENFDEAVATYRGRHKAGDKVTVLVARKQDDGSYKKKKLKGKCIETRLRGMHHLSLDPKATEKQVATRKAWLGS